MTPQNDRRGSGPGLRESDQVNQEKANHTDWLMGNLRNFMTVLTFVGGIITVGTVVFALFLWKHDMDTGRTFATADRADLRARIDAGTLRQDRFEAKQDTMNSLLGAVLYYQCAMNKIIPPPQYCSTVLRRRGSVDP